MASWMFWPRVGRTGRSLRNRRGSEDDHVHLDLSKDISENAKEILCNVCKKEGITDGKKLAYMNTFVKLLSVKKGCTNFGYSKEDILCCLRVAVVHESTQIRAGALRVVRHLVNGERDVVTLIRLRFPYLIARCIDLVLLNEMERIQALRLARRILSEAPRLFPPEIICCLVCLANGGLEEKDRLFKVALATLAEICVLNPTAFVNCGGVGTLGRNLLECGAPRVSECLAGCLLYLLDKPETRREANVCLHTLAAPYCDFHYRHTGGAPDKNREDREMRFNCSRLALLSVLRSWPGVLQFCCPSNMSGLRSIVEILYLRQLDIRKAVLDLLYDLLGVHIPLWTDKASVALKAVDPSSPKESWSLGEGFVFAEARALLPHLARFRPNLVEIHLSLLLYTLVKCGLLEALVDVIVTSDVFLSIRATILLGELLHLMHQLLPPQCCQPTPGLPTLIGYATAGVEKLSNKLGVDDVEEQQMWRQQALSAVAILSKIHQMKERQPTPSSLFLDQILQFASLTTGTSDRAARSKLYQLVMKDGDEAMKESGVLANKDPLFWNWVIIRAVLKNRSDNFKRLEDSSLKTFIRRLVDYFKPSTPSGYGRVVNSGSTDEIASQIQIQSLVGIELIEFLVEADEAEGGKILGEFLTDVSKHIQMINTSSSVHDTSFNPQNMATTLSRFYFLFLGRLSHHSRGLRALGRSGVFQVLLDLVASTSHDCYVKLVISSFDYSIDGMARVILKRALTAPSESCRLYATQFTLVLIRSRLPGLHRWLTELLVDQLGDPKRSVSLAAASILSEACDDQEFLEKLVSLRPSLLHLGDPGLLLLVRFLSLPSGFTSLHDANFVSNEIQRWTQTYNVKYVRIVEGIMHEALSHHQRDEANISQRVSGTSTSASHAGANGSSSQNAPSAGGWTGVAGGGWGFHPRGGGRQLPEVYVPPHLYGQLVQHQKGVDVLVREANLSHIFQVIRLQQCAMDDEILCLKAALWAAGHLCTSGLGVAIVESEGIVGEMVRCATTCSVYSIRGTAICALGLVASTRRGSEALTRVGWSSVKHHRHEKWPLVEEDADGEELKSGVYDPSKQLWTMWQDDTEFYSGTPPAPSSAPENSPHWWTNSHLVDSATVLQSTLSSSIPPSTGFHPIPGRTHTSHHAPANLSLSSSHSSPPHSSSSSLLATSRSHSRMSLSAASASHVTRTTGHEEDGSVENSTERHFYIPDDMDMESVGSTGVEEAVNEEVVARNNFLSPEGKELRPKSSTLPCPRLSGASASGNAGRGQRSNHYRSLSESKGPYHSRPASGHPSDGVTNHRGVLRHGDPNETVSNQGGVPKIMTDALVVNAPVIVTAGGKSRSSSCTDSTASGVSSCDSAHASRTHTGGGVQTLSPIPSSASLNTLRSSSQPHHNQPRSRKSSEGRSRAGSLQSDRGSVGGSSLSGWVLSMGSGLRGSVRGLSGEGARGFTVLRFLNRSRRPQPSMNQFFSSKMSPSCTDLAMGRDLLESWVYVPSRSGIALGLGLSHGIQMRPQNSRALKVRSLDRNVRTGLPPELEAPLLRAPSASFSAASLRSFTMPSTTETEAACYRGIALPKDLSSVYPYENEIESAKETSVEEKDISGVDIVDDGVDDEVGEVAERGPSSWWRMGVVRESAKRRRRHARRGGSGIYGVSFGELEELRETGEESGSEELEDSHELGEGGVREVGTSIGTSASSSSSSPSSSVSMGEGWVWRGGGAHRTKRVLTGGEVSIGPHRPDRCLACCVRLLGQQRRNTRRSRDVSTGSCRNRTDTESSGEKYLTSGEKESPVAHRRKGTTLSMIPGASGSGNALTRGSEASSCSVDMGMYHKSDETEDEADNSSSKSVIRKEVLKYIMRMSNPLWWKLSRQTLLSLKQKHPQSFQDVCLYSEVSACLGSASYRLIARRFIQELFYDLTFDELYEHTAGFLHLTESSSVPVNTGASSTASNALTAAQSASPSQLPTSNSSINVVHAPPTKTIPQSTSTQSSVKIVSSVSPPPSNVTSPSGTKTIVGLPSLAEESSSDLSHKPPAKPISVKKENRIKVSYSLSSKPPLAPEKSSNDSSERDKMQTASNTASLSPKIQSASISSGISKPIQVQFPTSPVPVMVPATSSVCGHSSSVAKKTSSLTKPTLYSTRILPTLNVMAQSDQDEISGLAKRKSLEKVLTNR
ncbi:hypothetical protein J437_LFUL005288 [Ladona fulva]|uniref:Rapamycin-insensitive companion of mTOR n=1 Tax=Ladona fulva TaxID=123851 RepID=A0A8K0K1M6_LADFU|nr:hypothetical protein J437_LFUL005288 [Ladona fulva]